MVRSVFERRLATTEAEWQFLVEAREPDELIVLSCKLTDEQIAEVKDILSRPGTLEFAPAGERPRSRGIDRGCG